MKKKIKIKLRDLTKEQFKKWIDENCITHNVICNSCPFCWTDCFYDSTNIWINHKDMFSDKFLDQELEIEVEENE